MTDQAQPKWLLILSAGLLVGGILLTAGSLRTAQRAKALPPMTCQDLEQKNIALPQFLTLTDVQLCAGGHAFRRDMDAAMAMYIPVFSTKLQQEPRPAELMLLLEVFDDRERDRLLERPVVGELAVELWTDARNLDPWVAGRLATLYPGIQLPKCRVISVGLHEPSAFRAAHQWRDGLAMLLLAAACQSGWWTWRRVSRSRRSVTRELVGVVGE